MDPDHARRVAARGSWPGRVYRPGDPIPDDDLSSETTAEERIDMMWDLVEQTWAVAGLPIPRYERREMPARVIRPDRAR